MTARICLPLEVRSPVPEPQPVQARLAVSQRLAASGASTDADAWQLRDETGLPVACDLLGGGAPGEPWQLAAVLRPGSYRLTPRVAAATQAERWRTLTWRPTPDGGVEAWRGDQLLLGYRARPLEGKPHLHPLQSPCGRPVTALGRPADSEGRTHLGGLWLAHREVNGHNFWDDRPGAGIQRHRATEPLTDGHVHGRLGASLTWETASGQVLLAERRELTVWLLPDGHWLLDLACLLTARDQPVTLGQTPFGLLGVRVAGNLAADRTGSIMASTGAQGEAEVFHTRARWCDYRGQIAPDRRAGLTVLDSDHNPDSPVWWRPRADGWLGAAACLQAAITIAAGETRAWRYRIWIHDGEATNLAADQAQEAFSSPATVTVCEPEEWEGQ